MQLPDFEHDPQFVRLRRLMGATEVIRLDPIDWNDWDGIGIDITDIDRVKVDQNLTLLYEGRRVLVYIRDQDVGHSGELQAYRYHIADCQTLSQMRDRGRFGRYVVTTRTDGRVVVNLRRPGESEAHKKGYERDLKVCKHCLKALNWKDYKNKFFGRNAVWNNFDLKEFFQHYGSRVSVLPTQAADTAPSSYNPPRTQRNRETQVRAGKDVLARASILNWFCYDCGLILEDLGARRWLKVYRASEGAQLKNLCLDCFSQKPGKEDIQQTEAFKEFQRWCGLGENGGAEGDD